MSIEVPHYKRGDGPEYRGNGQSGLPTLFQHALQKPEIRSVLNGNSRASRIRFQYSEGKHPRGV
jgi:hypothetical protein